MIVSDNGRTSKISRHFIIIFRYPAIRVKLLLTNAWCKTLITSNNLGMLDKISDRLPWLDCTTYVMLVEDELDVIVLDRGRISTAEVIVSNVIALKQRSKPVIDSFKWVR